MKQLFLLLFITSFSSAFSQDREIFKVVENMPVFPGCEIGDNQENQICTKQKLNQYIDDNLIYPDSALMMGIEGKVFVQFVITAEGIVTDVKAVRDLGYGCGDAAVKTVLGMNDLSQKWTPGKQRDRKVEVLYTLPVEFKLDDMIFEDAQSKPFIAECALLLDTKEKEDCTMKNIWSIIGREIRYPFEAREKGIEGTVDIEFVIDKEGKLVEFAVDNGIGYGCDEAALYAVKKLSKSNLTWIPAKQNNKNVNYLYKIPVKFHLEDSIKKKKKK
jgi:TonB family protein